MLGKLWSKLRPSPSMAVSLLALIIALGGAGVAANGDNFILGATNQATLTSSFATSVNSKGVQIINGSTGTDATALGLFVAAGKPPFTVNSSSKVEGLNADFLDGTNASSFVRTSGEGWHYVGDAGNVAFLNGWSNFDTTTNHVNANYQHLAYRKDPSGIIHIRGLVKGGTIGQDIIRLPSAYCPGWVKVFPVISNNAFARITVGYAVSGQCQVFANFGSNAWISFEGVSYPNSFLDRFNAALNVSEASVPRSGLRILP